MFCISSNIAVFFLTRLPLFNFVASKDDIRIIGGRDVRPEELPFVVRIELIQIWKKKVRRHSRRHPYCTASVLKPTWSITAAHCDPFKKIHEINSLNIFESISPVITYGSPDGRPLDTENRSRILSFVRHPHLALHGDQVFDVALIKTEPIYLKQYMRISALEVITLYGQEILVAGYGLTNTSDNTLQSTFYSNKPLQVVKGMIMKCGPKNKQMPLPNVCVVPKCTESPTVCNGDSGGPLIHSTGVIGIISMAFTPLNCQMRTDKIRYPNIVVAKPLSLMIDWLTDTVTENLQKATVI